jgi:predicted DNA-binding transcriptional regulator
MPREANHAAAVAERAVRELATGPGAQALEGLARFLLRSEAIASSLIPEVPILTTRTALRRLDVSFPAARAALEELADAGILARRSVERGTTGYTATDVFSLVTHAERQLASTRWDTRVPAPSRPVPAPPQN